MLYTGKRKPTSRDDGAPAAGLVATGQGPWPPWERVVCLAESAGSVRVMRGGGGTLGRTQVLAGQRRAGREPVCAGVGGGRGSPRW